MEMEKKKAKRGEANMLWIRWKRMCLVTHDICSLVYAERLFLFLILHLPFEMTFFSFSRKTIDFCS